MLLYKINSNGVQRWEDHTRPRHSISISFFIKLGGLRAICPQTSQQLRICGTYILLEVQKIHTIDKKDHCCFLCNIIWIRNKSIHIKNWTMRIIVWSFYFYQIECNRNSINRSDRIKPRWSGYWMDICPGGAMLIPIALQKRISSYQQCS